MSLESESVWITPAALASMENEVAELSRPDRPHEAADQVRLVELRSLLRRAEVGAKPDDGLVEPGMTVTVRFPGDDSSSTFLFGHRDLLGAVEKIETCSPDSPLGAAVNGRFVGDRVSFAAPTGARIEVEIVAATPYPSA